MGRETGEGNGGYQERGQDETIVIDGSHGEGGGQMVRTSVSMSALTGIPVRVHNIRARRSNPGLRPQHKEGVEALAQLSSAKVEGLRVGSDTITFWPGDISGGKYEIDIGTAGSIPLLIQAILLPALWAPDEVFLRIHGGTDVKWSPSIEYIHFVLFSMLKRIGIEINLALVNRGYYPRGGGEVEVRICPICSRGPAPMRLEEREGKPRIFGSAHAGNLPQHIPERMVETVRKSLEGEMTVDMMRNQWETRSPGAGITLVAEFENTFLGSCAIGEKGKRAEVVAEEAVDDLMAELDSGPTVDIHMADQLIPFMAIATGPSEYLVRRITDHTRTNMWVIEKFLETEFEIVEEGDDNKGPLHRVRVTPSGLPPPPPGPKTL